MHPDKLNKSKRHDQSHEDDHDTPHVDEKWLVSYSDMMTLLFGLFVMLYSIAMKNKGTAEAVEKALKEISEKGFKSEQVQQTTSNLDKDQLQKLVQKLSADLKYEKDKNINLSKAQESSFIENQKLKIGYNSIEKNLKETQSKQEVRMVASTPSPAVVNQIYYLSVKWENPNHDYDLTVENPHGQKFSTLKRSHSNNLNEEFVFSSEKGPHGKEMFRTKDPLPGTYNINVSLYNSRGDDSETQVGIYLISPAGEELLIDKLTFFEKDKKSTDYQDTDFSKNISIDFSKYKNLNDSSGKNHESK